MKLARSTILSLGCVLASLPGRVESQASTDPKIVEAARTAREHFTSVPHDFSGNQAKTDWTPIKTFGVTTSGKHYRNGLLMPAAPCG